MGAGSGIYMHDVVVKSSRSLSHLLMSSCYRMALCIVFNRANLAVMLTEFVSVSCSADDIIIAIGSYTVTSISKNLRRYVSVKCIRWTCQ